MCIGVGRFDFGRVVAGVADLADALAVVVVAEPATVVAEARVVAEPTLVVVTAFSAVVVTAVFGAVVDVGVRKLGVVADDVGDCPPASHVATVRPATTAEAAR